MPHGSLDCRGSDIGNLTNQGVIESFCVLDGITEQSEHFVLRHLLQEGVDRSWFILQLPRGFMH